MNLREFNFLHPPFESCLKSCLSNTDAVLRDIFLQELSCCQNENKSLNSTKDAEGGEEKEKNVVNDPYQIPPELNLSKETEEQTDTIQKPKIPLIASICYKNDDEIINLMPSIINVMLSFKNQQENFKSSNTKEHTGNDIYKIENLQRQQLEKISQWRRDFSTRLNKRIA